MNILRIDSSGRLSESVSRQMTALIVQRLRESNSEADVVERDVTKGLPFVDMNWVAGAAQEKHLRSTDESAVMDLSEDLIAELKRADVLVLGAPIYNFGIPAALKAWIDMVCRAGHTFKYSEAGPVGLLEGKRAYLVVTSGGTSVGSDIDFSSDYLRHVLGFIGISDITLIAADRLLFDGEEKIAQAKQSISRLVGQVAA